jgi:hypothetical protein
MTCILGKFDIHAIISMNVARATCVAAGSISHGHNQRMCPHNSLLLLREHSMRHFLFVL